MLDRLKNFILSHQLIDESDKIALAISGGKDSVAAAYMLNEMNIPFVMVHVNFGLRGSESDSDMLFVKKLSTKLSYCSNIFSKKVETEVFAREHNLNTQLAARDLRYEYFEQLKNEGHFTKIITAHHQSDLVETFFINLNRKSGINGLKSIPVRRDYIIRPFLALNSYEILDYLNTHNIEYREDSSNASNKYARNLLRNKILPSIAKELQNFEHQVIGSIQILQQENEVLNWLIDEKIDSIVRKTSNRLSIDSETLATYPQRTVFLYRILDKYGFTHSQCKQILANSTSAGALFYSITHQLLIDRKTFIVQKNEDRDNASVEITSAGNFMLGKHRIEITKTSVLNFSNNPKEETVSMPSHLFPLLLRYWQEGDRIQPLGMKGSKLVSDFFIDEKINNLDKHSIPLLCKEHEVLWVCGFRISDKMKLKSDKNIHRLTLHLKDDTLEQ